MSVLSGTEMVLRLREATGTEGDGHVPDAELLRALTYGVSDTWDTLLSMGIGTEGVKNVSFLSVSGQQEYPIATVVPALDFYQVSRMLTVQQDGTGRLIPVSRVNPSEQYTLAAPTGAFSMKLYYFPKSPVFITGAETFDGVNGWEEHAIMCAAVHIKAKKEDDAGRFLSRKRELEARMAVMSNRLRDEPPRIVRRATQAQRGYCIPYTTSIRGYDLRGGNIELFAGLYV